MSSSVVPPTNGLNTSFDSPNTPWQLAHLPSQISMPLATEPAPLGRPWKSGRTSMSQAFTSAGVAARPMPGKRSCAWTPAVAARTSAASRNLGNVDIAHLPALLHQPRLDGVVVIDRALAAHLAQLRAGGLHVT